MRTGGEYREALRDGRRVWVMGEGWVEDVTTHPATRAMVEEYALWYDRHLDPAWQELLLAMRRSHVELWSRAVSRPVERSSSLVSAGPGGDQRPVGVRRGPPESIRGST